MPAASSGEPPRNPLYVLLNNVRSLANVGAVFRWCDAARAEKLYLCGITGYPSFPGDERMLREQSHSQRQIEKVAIKTVDYVTWEKRQSALEVVKELKSEGVHIGVLEQTAGSVDYRRAELSFPLCIVAGHEREGVEAELIACADSLVQIPLYGRGTSLNVAMAVGLMLYRALDQLGISQGLRASSVRGPGLRQGP